MNKSSVCPQGLELVEQTINRAYVDCLIAGSDDRYDTSVLFELTACADMLYKALASIKRAEIYRDKTAQQRLEISDGHCFGWESKVKKGGCI